MIPVTGHVGKTVAVFGLGLSGMAAARALRAGGADVIAWDDTPAGIDKACAEGFTARDLRQADWRAIAALVLAPGVPLTHPEPHWTVKLARAAGVPVIGDTELFSLEHARSNTCAKIAAITGTNGKSTTSALTAHILAAAGRKTALGGNIGTPVLDLPPFADDMHYVIEYSSFQIDLTPSLRANAAALLNITPDHLDRHGTLANYAAVKARIFDTLGPGDRAVISIDDQFSASIAYTHPTRAEVCRISCETEVSHGVYAKDGRLIEVVRGLASRALDISGVGSLRGVHNWQNAAAAVALTRALGLSLEEIEAGLKSFPGLAHRMEEVARLGRVLFINDSKATNADAAAKALAALDQIYWIAGGRAKAGGLAGLEAFFPRIRKTYLIGEAEEAFARALAGRLAIERCGVLEAAVERAASDAAASSDAAPVVLLSPACASFDQYPNFMARGEAFRAAVASLRGVAMRSEAAA